MSTTLIIICILIAMGIIAFVVYKILRFMRGSIKIVLRQTNFNPGEMIAGTFELEIRKGIEGDKLYAALIGEKVTEEPSRDPSRRVTTRTEVYRDELIFELEKLYKAGKTMHYNFEFDTGNAQNVVGESEPSGGLLGQTLNEGLELAGDIGLLSKQSLEWKVEVKLVAKGIDLVSSKEVYVNIMNSEGGFLLTPRDIFR